MDYDLTSIPEAYDRGRDHGTEVLDQWMRAITSYVSDGPIGIILDLGCGTGRFSGGLAQTFEAVVVGLDPSAKMLQQAVRKRDGDRVHDAHRSTYRHGAGERRASGLHQDRKL